MQEPSLQKGNLSSLDPHTISSGGEVKDRFASRLLIFQVCKLCGWGAEEGLFPKAHSKKGAAEPGPEHFLFQAGDFCPFPEPKLAPLHTIGLPFGDY